MLADYEGNTSVSKCDSSCVFGDTFFDLLFLMARAAREPWRQSTSWGDIVEEEPSRPPGHGIHMHEKLSSPSRKRY